MSAAPSGARGLLALAGGMPGPPFGDLDLFEQQGSADAERLRKALKSADVVVQRPALDAELVSGLVGGQVALDIHTQYGNLRLFPLSVNKAGIYPRARRTAMTPEMKPSRGGEGDV
jgi:hypothetical protein